MPGFVTTSWDDGGSLDLKLASALRSHGLTGTMYWSVAADQFPSASESETAAIIDLGMEIGSHTMTHPDLTAIDGDTLRWELTESKTRLETLVGAEVSSFCYPFGRFNKQASEAVRGAGYRIGRTTVGFRNTVGSDPFRMPVTIQMYPHGPRVHVSHAVKELNVSGLGRWLTTYGRATDLLKLVETATRDAERSGGVMHLWGHSWEIENYDLWGVLDDALEIVSGATGLLPVTNGELAARAFA